MESNIVTFYLSCPVLLRNKLNPFIFHLILALLTDDEVHKYLTETKKRFRLFTTSHA